ncbi:MAG TPA: hypothetical protein PKL60_07485 [Anaerolineaceae bacterium]|nr:hypothetical protein [Anaerolineaceae bacterium]
MPGILHCLSGHDLGFLRSAADLWGLNLSAKDAPAYGRALASALAQHPELEEIAAALPDESRAALAALQSRGGSLPWAAFTRQYGDLRQMGPARRAREKPHFFPQSTTERLWYRALIGRDFFRQGDDLVELAYIPDEFLERLPVFPEDAEPSARLEPEKQVSVERALFWQDRILDESCTLLAALRRFGTPEVLREAARPGIDWELLRCLLGSLGIIDRDGKTPAPEARRFLEMPRGQSLQWLAAAWMNSIRFDELRLAPGLVCQGTWPHNPLPARRALLHQLAGLENGAWYAIDAFSAELRRENPEYLRAGGDANEWIILSAKDGRLFRRPEDWLEVEGAWTGFLIRGLLFWLGFVELGFAAGAEEPAYFRKSNWCAALLSSREPLALPAENSPAAVSSTGLISLNRGAPRTARYQLARFSEWLENGPERWQYLLTPASLSAAAEQGLNMRHLSALLRKYAKPAPPPSLMGALARWETNGREASIERLWVLRLRSPEALQALRESPAAGFLGEALGPASVIVHPGGLEKVRAALARLGTLSDVEELLK